MCKEDTAIEYIKNAQPLSLKPVLNESHQPDPNLTQLAALNDLSLKNMQEMIQKVAALMKRPDFARTGQPSANVYQTIFNIKSLRQRLARPAIELNSDRAPQAAKSPKGGSGGAEGRGSGPDGGGPGGGGPGGPPVQIDPAVLKASVAKFVKEAYGDSPEKAVQAAKVLVSDFVIDPGDVSFPDRNALMLAIQFLRTYNKEINMDIEITPEEVLLVKQGLDPGVRRYMAGLLQHLGILIRGIGRVGQESDFALLEDIQKRQQGFMNLSEEPRHMALVRRTLGAIDSAKHEISNRNDECRLTNVELWKSLRSYFFIAIIPILTVS